MLKEHRLRVWSLASGGSTSAEEDHFQRLSRLVELESEAEARKTRETLGRLSPADAERTGESLIGLVIIEEDSGLGGRCILTLAKRNRTLPLPWNRLGPGTPVLLAPEGGSTTEGCRGVVCERRKEALRVAVNDPPQEADRETTYRLDLSSDEIARQRQVAALERVRTASRDRLAELRGILLGDVPPTFEVEKPVAPLDSAVNQSQQEAVGFALSAKDLAVLHGPPGTGKTTALVEFIRH